MPAALVLPWKHCRLFTLAALPTTLEKLTFSPSQHISSADPLASPAIDASYLQHPADKFLLAKAGQFLRQLATNSTLSEFVESENEPGLSVETDAEWESWVEGAVRTE